MPTCSSCGGEGFRRSSDPEEEIRGIMESCYHCAETGMVDEETDYEDRLKDVAAILAGERVRDYVQAVNEGEDGFALYAAENGMSESDYRMVLGWQYQDEIAPQLFSMMREEQAFMLEINNPDSWYALCRRKEPKKVLKPAVYPVFPLSTDNDIPF